MKATRAEGGGPGRPPAPSDPEPGDGSDGGMGGTDPAMRLMALMQLTDSALPTGAFSHSQGFETYLSRGDADTQESFAAWLEMFVAQQLTFTDAVAVRAARRATTFAEIASLDALVTAQALPRQIREGSATMGRRLLTIGAAAYPGGLALDYLAGVEAGELHAHPAVVQGVLARTLGVSESEAVTAHLYSTVISLTQNAVRAIPLGQNAGQRIIRAAQAWVHQALLTSASLDLDDLGAISPGLEIAQMNHERQRARLFMS